MKIPRENRSGPLLVVGGVVWLGPRRLAVQRRAAAASHGAGMLEFPGGKLEVGETPQVALLRELREEWGPAAEDLELGPPAQILTRAIPPAADPGHDPMILMLFHLRWVPRSADPGIVEGIEAWTGRVRCEPGAELVVVDLNHPPLSEFMTPDRTFAEQLAAGLAAESDAPDSQLPAHVEAMGLGIPAWIRLARRDT